MLITDIKPYTGFNLYFQRELEPRRIELAKHMGTYKQIQVYEIRKHDLVKDVDTDGTDWAVVGEDYCMYCKKTKSELNTNECKVKIGTPDVTNF